MSLEAVQVVSGPIPPEVTYVLNYDLRLQHRKLEARAKVIRTHAPHSPMTVDLSIAVNDTTLQLIHVPQGTSPGCWYATYEDLHPPVKEPEPRPGIFRPDKILIATRSIDVVLPLLSNVLRKAESN